MSRIERVSRRSYAKIPSKTEQKIVDVINQYFDSVICSCAGGADLTEEAKQLLINEIIVRLYPVINQLSSDAAQQLIEEAIQRILAELGSSQDPISSLEYVSFEATVTADGPFDRIVIPSDKVMLMNKGDFIVTVNGIEQYYMINYTLVPDINNPAKVWYVNFGESILEEGDSVQVEMVSHSFIQRNKYTEVIEENSDFDTISMPISARMDLLMGNMLVMVNGQLQEPIYNFDYILHPDYATLVVGIQFEEGLLQPGDIVDVTLEYRPQAKAVEFTEIIDAEDDKRYVDVPATKQIQVNSTRLTVFINGQKQSPGNYEILPDDVFPVKAGSIDFIEEILEEEDVIHVIA